MDSSQTGQLCIILHTPTAGCWLCSCICSQLRGQALGIGTLTEHEMVLFGIQTKTARIFLDAAEVAFSEQSVCSMNVLQPHAASFHQTN